MERRRKSTGTDVVLKRWKEGQEAAECAVDREIGSCWAREVTDGHSWHSSVVARWVRASKIVTMGLCADRIFRHIFVSGGACHVHRSTINLTRPESVGKRFEMDVWVGGVQTGTT